MNFVAENSPGLASQNLVKLEPKGTVSITYSLVKKFEPWICSQQSLVLSLLRFIVSCI